MCGFESHLRYDVSHPHPAQVAELVDALVSEASVR